MSKTDIISQKAIDEVWAIVMGKAPATPQTARKVQAAILQLQAERNRLQAKIDKLWEIHSSPNGKWCDEDGYSLPCPTLAALIDPPEQGVSDG